MAPKRIAALAIGTATLAASALYIAVTFQWRAALETLVTARPAWFLLGGSAAVLGYWMTRALRWSYLMRGMQSTPGFFDLYLCSSVALGLAVLTPLQSGEAFKVELLRKYAGGARLPGYSAFLIERTADLYVVAAMAAISLAAPILAIAVVVLPLGIFFALRRVRVGGRLGQFVAHLQGGVGSLWKLMVLLALTALGWIIVALGWQACLLSLSIRLDLLDVVGLVCIVTLASTLTFIPGGLGIADASAAALLIRHGVDLPLAQAGAILLRGFTPLVVALGIAHLLWLRGRGTL
ncbi:MAG TPA: lysylphosphatidylglycerol synthase transmembrane domain-containing protein [Burkholderiales bacterium]